MSDFKIDYKLIGPQTYDRGDVGEKSKKLARKNIIIDREQTQINISNINLINFNETKIYQ